MAASSGYPPSSSAPVSPPPPPPPSSPVRLLLSSSSIVLTSPPGVIREPLKGVEAICPVGNSFDSPELELAAWVASPETTIKNFVIAMQVPADKFLKHTRVVCLPGFTTTVREEIEALEKVAGKDALKLIKFQDDPVNRRIVSSWPARFDNSYPLSLGFVVDEGGMVPIVQKFKQDVEAGLA